MKYFIPLFSAFIIVVATVQTTQAKEKNIIEYKPLIVHSVSSVKVERAQNLENFFIKYKSPLVGTGTALVSIADEYEIDYRLIPAIAGMESTLCKRIPHESNNCWGWGVYGDNVIRFESFEDGAEKVAKGLKENYIGRGLDTPEKIAPVYTPPNSGNWKVGVRFFMTEIDKSQSVDRT